MICSKCRIAAAILAGGALWALAQSHVRIVHLSYVSPGVSVSHAPMGEARRPWSRALWNAPLVEGDAVRTGPGARAEAQLECGSALRLGSNSEFSFPRLALSRRGVPMTTVALVAGKAGFSMRQADTRQFQVTLPGAAVEVPGNNARFEVTIAVSGVSVQVVTGEARVDIGGRAYALRKAQRLVWSAGGMAQPSPAARPGRFALWNQKRDRSFDRALLTRRLRMASAQRSWSAPTAVPSPLSATAGPTGEPGWDDLFPPGALPAAAGSPRPGAISPDQIPSCGLY